MPRSPLDEHGRPRNDPEWPHGHRERLRNRYRAGGFAALTESEIVQLMLGPSCPRGDMHPLADRLLARFGSLQGILAAKAEELQTIKGCGEIMAFHVSLFLPLVEECRRRCAAGKKLRLGTPDTTIEFAKTLPEGRLYECVWVLILNALLELTHWEMLSQGDPASVHFSPQAIARIALQHSAHHVIMVHSHTAGPALPSVADMQATRQVRAALEALNIQLCDHIIISGESTYSFSQHGELQPPEIIEMPVAAMPLSPHLPHLQELLGE
ncbi:MAG: Mov34/MPN/PAD-1 family protein [Clostridia bacterium]|nr:Mov34/MPN/PAD-1 family protein [Clostridia bacterium]